jgi:hypothetical protein
MNDITRYDIVQTTFLMSMVADEVSGIVGTQAQLQSYLSTALSGGIDPLGTQFGGFFPLTNPQLAGGDWSVVWGPCVYSLKPAAANYATNAMYAAYSPSLSTYVVAIAGTNPESLYDWIQEDGDVAVMYMAKWPFALPFVRTSCLPWGIDSLPAISAATAQGVSNLLCDMTDPANGTLQTFLTLTANPNSTLIFTGHSLAGALAPALALYLYPQPQNSGWKQVVVLPLAGASPGNAPFAALFSAASAFPPVASGVNAPYGNWNTDYANTHDVVPHAWNQLDVVISGLDSSGNFPSIYGALNPFVGAGLTDVVVAAKALAIGADYQNLTQVKFSPDWGAWTWIENPDGSWQYPPVWTALATYADANPISTVDELGTLIVAAHIDQYYNFFRVIPTQRMPTSTPESIVQANLDQALLAAAKMSV